MRNLVNFVMKSERMETLPNLCMQKVSLCSCRPADSSLSPPRESRVLLFLPVRVIIFHHFSPLCDSGPSNFVVQIHSCCLHINNSSALSERSQSQIGDIVGLITRTSPVPADNGSPAASPSPPCRDNQKEIYCRAAPLHLHLRTLLNHAIMVWMRDVDKCSALRQRWSGGHTCNQAGAAEPPPPTQ